jgi:hypothetical protein
MRKFGTHRYGIPNKDDLFDYTEEAGKPTGIDIRNRK